jgi:hypothetical protein
MTASVLSWEKQNAMDRFATTTGHGRRPAKPDAGRQALPESSTLPRSELN